MMKKVPKVEQNDLFIFIFPYIFFFDKRRIIENDLTQNNVTRGIPVFKIGTNKFHVILSFIKVLKFHRHNMSI